MVLQNKFSLLSMLFLTSSFCLVEIIVGYATNSMALVADSFHMLSDVVALLVAFLAVWVSPKKWSKNTFGWARAEVLGALINSVFLMALCFSIFVESLKRFIEVETIRNPKLILIVGVIGLLVNLIGLLLFSGHGHHHHTHAHKHQSQSDSPDQETELATDTQQKVGLSSPHSEPEIVEPSSGPPRKPGHSHAHSSEQMNMRGVFLHVLADAIGSVIVIISALVIWLTDWTYKNYVDPILSLVMVVLILQSVWPLLVDSAMILLQTVPTHIRLENIEEKLLREVDGVLAVHEFHVWRLTGNRIIASAHVRCHNLPDYMKVAEQIKELFHNEGIHSTTIQPEFVDYEETVHNGGCMLDCPKSQIDTCLPSKCCLKTSPLTSEINSVRLRSVLTQPSLSSATPSILDNISTKISSPVHQTDNELQFTSSTDIQTTRC